MMHADSTVVVTGALGHIGSRLIRELPSQFPGAQVLMIDNLSTQRYASLFHLPAGGRYRFVEADVLKADLAALFRGSVAVIHLAAIADATGSFAIRGRVEEENYTGTLRVAEACVQAGACLFFPSSTSVYGTQQETVDEACSPADLRPQSPYAETKLREEAALIELGKTGGLRFVIARFGTIFGTSAGMRFHTAVNKFCWQAVLGQPVTVWKTALHQKRPYLDLGDACRAIAFMLGSDLFDRSIYNVLTLNATVLQILEAIRKHVPGLKTEFVDHEIMNQLSYEVSDRRARQRGFQPSGRLEEGIAQTIAMLRACAGKRELADADAALTR